MSQPSESNIDRLRQRLNSRNGSGNDPKEGKLSTTDRSSVRGSWGHDEPPHDDEFPPIEDDSDDGRMSFLNKLLIFSCIFFVLAFGFALFSVGTGEGDISPDKVNIVVSGPDSVSAGDTVDFMVSITNQNKVPLQSTELVIMYPDGTRDPANTGEELRRTRYPLGEIAAGRTTQQTVTASLFGKQGQTRTLEVQLEYRVEESNAIFSADAVYDLEITEAPVSLDVAIPSEVTPGQPFTTEVIVTSNSSKILKDILLVARYPVGFSVQEVSPESAYRQYVWQLGDISPGAQRTVEIIGSFTDKNAVEEQAFHFNGGIAQVSDNTAIGTLFAEQDEVVSLNAPFIDLDMNIDVRQNKTDNNLVIEASIDWQSNLTSLVRGGQVVLKVTGDGVDYGSIYSDTGLYDAGSRSVIWNPQTNSELMTISPGDSGEFEFELVTQQVELLADIAENPTINISVRMQATAPDSSSLPDPVTASLQRTVRLPTMLQLTANTLREDGPFSNTGPIPPEVGEETSYTLHLSVSNTTNEVSDAQLSAALPAYVEINGSPLPTGSSFSYNEVSGRIRWEIGTVPAGAGYNTGLKEIFIPVVIRPTQNHIGNTLPLLEDISITGTDASRKEAIQINNISLPTTNRDDLRSRGGGEVQP